MAANQVVYARISFNEANEAMTVLDPFLKDVSVDITETDNAFELRIESRLGQKIAEALEAQQIQARIGVAEGAAVADAAALSERLGGLAQAVQAGNGMLRSVSKVGRPLGVAGPQAMLTGLKGPLDFERMPVIEGLARGPGPVFPAFEVSPTGALLLQEGAEVRSCADSRFIATGVESASRPLGFSLWTNASDWMSNTRLIQEVVEAARFKATAAAMKAVESWLSENRFDCPEPCVSQVRIRVYEPSLPGPSIGSTTVGETQVGVGAETPNVANVGVSSSFGYLWLRSVVPWDAYLVCQTPTVAGPIRDPGPLRFFVQGAEAQKTSAQGCPEFHAWGYGRYGLAIATRQPRRSSEWTPTRDQWQGLVQARRAEVRAEAYKNAAHMASLWVGHAGLCPPSCPSKVASITLGPVHEGEDILDYVDYWEMQRYYMWATCLWTVRHTCGH